MAWVDCNRMIMFALWIAKEFLVVSNVSQKTNENYQLKDGKYHHKSSFYVFKCMYTGPGQLNLDTIKETLPDF